MQRVDRAVVRDVQQPGPERRIAAPAREAVVGAQERVLRHVLGVVLADDPGRDAEHDVAMALDEPLEGPQIARECRPHQVVVRRRHQTL